MKCHNCCESGHFAGKCPKPQNGKRPCFICGSEKHLAASCVKKEDSRGTDVNKEIRKVSEVKQNDSRGDDYHKVVRVGHEIEAFIDLGSDCGTLRKTEAENMKLNCLPAQITLKGFGTGQCTSTYINDEKYLIIEGIPMEVETLIVPDKAQEEPMIIGRNALEKPELIVTMRNGKLEIKREEPAENQPRKIMRVKESIEETNKNGERSFERRTRKYNTFNQYLPSMFCN